MGLADEQQQQHVNKNGTEVETEAETVLLPAQAQVHICSAVELSVYQLCKIAPCIVIFVPHTSCDDQHLSTSSGQKQPC